jgi:tRNA (adenine22-N1)-methyltransferase
MSWKLPDYWREDAHATKPRGEFRGFGLSARLAAVAGCVGIGARVIDVGTDHGLLPIALIGSGRASFAIAGDLRPDPLSVAASNVRRFRKEEKVELRLADGLEALEPNEADTVTIAGMSGERMVEILLAVDLEKLGVSRIIVQPNSDQVELRQKMTLAGWEVVHERLVACGGRMYVVIVLEVAEEDHSITQDDALVGPILKTHPADPLYRAWCDVMRGLLTKRVNGLSRGSPGSLELEEGRAQLAAFEALDADKTT